MSQCICGYTHAHIQHVCWAPPLKHGTRTPVGERCKCGALHAHIEHDCSGIKAKPVFKAEPASVDEALAQFAQGWRPPNMCKDCPSLMAPCKACWVRAGYKAEHYLTASELV